ncbi:hypothetical protein ATE47_01355 [Chryseobacterium sp. IHB B 17019]|uniref:hypothetical protein n=1 Tax=Chryseobacterium sp. IHB B 17019 TaxID=1721091 RepID=UPI00071FF557|nr:hypothetical protein [Chryseobacterium sp. IHB B 17019]ALR29259.1 hypothetical protein ATE47_01355 [Chryseobacterium sp. IHB B 17019]
MKGIDITEGLATSVWSSLSSAIKSNNSDAVYSFVSFFRGILRESLIYSKLDPFTEFVSFPVIIYSRIAYQHKKHQTYGEMIGQISEQMSLHLKEVVMSIGFHGKTLSDKSRLNDFYYQAFKTYNNLFYQQARFLDWNLLASSLKRYSHLTGEMLSGSESQVIKLKNLIANNQDGTKNEEISKLEFEIRNQTAYDNFRRQPLTALKYWLFFLFDERILELENLNRLLRIITEERSYDQNKEIEDILFFRTADLRIYMGWEDWDYIERPENEIYAPPMPVNWMTQGFVVDRIRTKNSNFTLSVSDPKLKATIPFFYDAVKMSLDVFRTDFEKWKKVLQVETIKDFNSIGEKLLSSIALAKRSVVGVKERGIAEAPLSQLRLDEFKSQAAAAWRSQTRIRKVFNYFGNIQDVTVEEILLKRVGTNNLLEKGKIHFIDGDYHQTIYGIDNFGATVGRWENSLFLDVIQKSDPTIIEERSLLLILEKSILQFHNNSVVPTAIFLEPEFLYKDEEFLKSPKYSGEYNSELNPDNVDFFVLGLFDGIPLFSFHSSHLKDKVIISDFRDAFIMYYKRNEAWVDSELSVIVTEVTDEIVDKKYSDNPEKWRFTDEGVELSEEDAKILIKTSVVVDIETIMDFKVIDKSKLIVGYITEPVPD